MHGCLQNRRGGGLPGDDRKVPTRLSRQCRGLCRNASEARGGDDRRDHRGVRQRAHVSEIADVARTWGAFVPELRPAHLSGDPANLTHALERSLRLLSSDSYQATTVCVLSPTNPFRQPQRLENALTRLATDHRLGCLRSMVPCRPHPADCATINREGAIRPIIAPRVPVGQESLSFNLFHLVQEPEQRVEAVLLDSIEGTDIDEPHDLLRARAILGAGLTPQLAPVLRALAI